MATYVKIGTKTQTNHQTNERGPLKKNQFDMRDEYAKCAEKEWYQQVCVWNAWFERI
jgi:hypothetical protein